MDKIQMVDLKSQYKAIKSDIDEAIQSVIDSTVFIKGGTVDSFATHLAQFLNVKHVIPVANGTDAIRLVLMALGLKPGDEVITPTFTFVATAEVAASIGCVPVLVDVDPDTFCMMPSAVEKAITPKTKAIIPVNLFGQNAPLEALKAIADAHGIALVEDACQSINSEYIFSNGSRVQSGTVGIAGCTSFFPSKNLGCYGDGGAVYTNNDELAAIVKSIANHGMAERYHYERVGLNSRLDAIQAAVLDVKLCHLNEYTLARQTAADKYRKQLADIDSIQLPAIAPYTKHVYHQFTLKVDASKRDCLRNKLQEAGIPSMVYYPIPLHLQKPYETERNRNGNFETAEKLCSQVLSLPMHTELTDTQIDYICDTIKKSIKNI